MTTQQHTRSRASQVDGANRIEVWGGIECTVNRLHDEWLDQTIRTGHDKRIEDLDLIADLGITTLRYPVVWERVVSHVDGPYDWTWTDERLARLRELGIRPIAGLVHHGSGPAGTDLLDPEFPEKLARYAKAVAQRYPWLIDYTPINEPLTTARFSALYGFWYPHTTDDFSFFRALLNECRAVVLAMAAIREVNPEARLIQTEDCGATFGTPALAGQVNFQNERRWASLDLLTGQLRPGMRMWEAMRNAGIAEDELQWFIDHPCPPDLIGLNYYLTSDRFLDDRIERYPDEEVGGNGHQRYVDIAALHIPETGAPSIGQILRSAWDRYALPLAVTEIQNGSGVDDKVRWLAEIWNEANRVRAYGVDLRAVTLWALFGMYDWHVLLRRDEGLYEEGVFDVSSGQPKATKLTTAVRNLVRHGRIDSPILDEQGWWHSDERILGTG